MKKRERDNGFEEWGGYMAAKMSKLEEQFGVEAQNFGLKEDNLFEGISIFVNGYTEPPAYELRNLMMRHGGKFHHYHRPDTLYIVASNLPDSKLKLVNKLTVIKPEWVTDCIKAGHLLNHKDYLLYTNQSKTQPLLRFDKFKKSSPPKTARNDQFLSEFYKNSRLHLISTMGATFKQYVNELRSKTGCFPGRDALMNNPKTTEDSDEIKWNSVIMHIDMDCFFVSVSLLQRPDLIGKPVAVTHSKGNNPSARPGVDLQAEYKAYHGSPSSDPNHWSNTGQTYSMAEVASCSYEARKAGVKNGMFMGQALALCPNLITLPYDFEGYKKVARILYDTVASFTLNIEAVSCDEMFVDCSELLSSASMTPLEFASVIRQQIKDKTQCPCSTGFGANKLQARLATRKAKPDGQFFLEPDMVLDFMSSVPVTDLPGVGRSSSFKLKSLGITNCSELQKMSLSSLKKVFGAKAGETLYNYAYGRDNKSLTLEKVRKSVSAEINYGIRFQADSERDKFLKQLCEEVSNRLTEVSMRGKSITLKIMVKSKDAPEETAKFLGHGVCNHFTKTNSLCSHTDDPVVILREVLSMMTQFNIPSINLRGIGIQVSKLISNQCSTYNLTKFFNVKPNNSENNDKYSEIASEDRLPLNAVHNDQSEIELLKNDFEKVDCFKEVLSTESLKTSQLASENTKLKNNDHLPSTSTPTDKHYDPQKKDKEKNSVFYTNDSVQPDLRNISMSQIDPTFFSALPEDLKAEILVAVRKKPIESVGTDVPRTNPVIDDSNTVGASKNESSDKDPLSKVSPVEMRGLLEEWVKSYDSPQLCDVYMFHSYLEYLVSSHQIDKLLILLKSFHRQLMRNNRTGAWSDTFRVSLEIVQSKMESVYGARLTCVQSLLFICDQIKSTSCK